MPLYMTQFAYTSEAWATLTQNPEGRSEAIRGLVETMGDRFISAYNTFGEYDGLVIFEARDEGTAAATAIAAITPGHQKSFKTTVLLSTEEGVEAMRWAGEVTFRRPGNSRVGLLDERGPESSSLGPSSVLRTEDTPYPPLSPLAYYACLYRNLGA
jgi:uncharacterized protein with GYD domain